MKSLSFTRGDFFRLASIPYQNALHQLASDDEERYDGLLEVHDVFSLDLQNASLVTLSACESNLPDFVKVQEGIISPGDEIIGLNRAFIYAGTPSVMATLWSVEDRATKNLMVAPK